MTAEILLFEERKAMTKTAVPPKPTVVENDPFDPSKLRLDQSFADTGSGVKKVLGTIPVRKPDRQTFFRVHPDPEYRLSPTALIELKEERGEFYLVLPTLADELAGEFSVYSLFLTINRQGVFALWPIKLPSADGRQTDWHRSAAAAAELATRKWVRMQANLSLNAYETYEATGSLSEPAWPEIPFTEVLRVAFRDRIVDSAQHPVIQRLRGAA